MIFDDFGRRIVFVFGSKFGVAAFAKYCSGGVKYVSERGSNTYAPRVPFPPNNDQ